MAELMDDGTPPGETLRAAAPIRSRGPTAPKVINGLPELFDNNWRWAWRMRPR
jgi:hypothetical protein